jgi:hypothetical protein
MDAPFQWTKQVASHYGGTANGQTGARRPREKVTMAQQKAPFISHTAIESLRRARDFEEWNRNFENLKAEIRRQISPRDMRPLVRAGAEEDKLLTWLAFSVYDSRGLSPELMARRKSLASLANQLTTVTRHATRIIRDPLYDGPFWLALEAGLPWDTIPQAGVIEASVLKGMNALSELIKNRGDALGKLSRDLKKGARTRSIRSLVAYVFICTKRKRNFDAEIAFLLTAAFKSAEQKKEFTADQIKKFRQRHLLSDLQNRDRGGSRPQTLGDGKSELKRLTFGQRIAAIR